MNILRTGTPVILISCAWALAACGPTYRTNYNLFPPATKEGQLCVANVKTMSDACLAGCEQMARSCRNPGGFSTSIGFGTGRYSHAGIGYGYQSDILDDRDCSAVQCKETCLAAARQSHLNCGGTITEEIVCTSNCPPVQK